MSATKIIFLPEKTGNPTYDNENRAINKMVSGEVDEQIRRGWKYQLKTSRKKKKQLIYDAALAIAESTHQTLLRWIKEYKDGLQETSE